MKSYDVEIYLMHGEPGEHLSNVTRLERSDGILSAYRDDEFANPTHLGSWPLVNVKKWVKRERQ